MEYPDWVRLSADVTKAINNQKAIVALESTVITHGLPRPLNLEVARRLESVVREHDAIPATIALLEGQICIGLSGEELERLALSEETVKVSTRDLSSAVAFSSSGGTTVAATAFIAEAVGIRVFATGGIGGVHRGDLGDVSADLGQIQQSRVAVVCAGAKSILDLPKTLEWLETHSIPVLGWQTDEFPAFYATSSGLKVTRRIDSLSDMTAVLTAHWRLGLGGILICAPCPTDSALPREQVEMAIESALVKAEMAQIQGKALTPFLLNAIAEATEGGSLTANQALLVNNARIAAQIALTLNRGGSD